MNSLENPFDKSRESNIQKILSDLCSLKVSLKVSPKGRSVCMFCKLDATIGFYDLIDCPCSQTVHIACFQADSSALISDPRSEKLRCFDCGRRLTQEDLLNAIGVQEFNRLLAEEKRRKENLRKEEELGRKALEELMKAERKLIEASKTFTCNICFTEKKIEESCITLQCEHQYCDECLKGYLESKILERKCLESDLVCPTPKCLKPIDPNILSHVLTKEGFLKLESFRMTMLRESILIQGEVFLKCPKGECNNVVVIDRNDQNITHHTCETCKTDFCVRGCPKPHRNLTCEKYNAWKEDNDQGDQRFDLMAAQEKLRNCPMCKAWVQRIEGCNYILCRCKYEFCYVCGAHCPKHRSKCGH